MAVFVQEKGQYTYKTIAKELMYEFYCQQMKQNVHNGSKFFLDLISISKKKANKNDVHI